MRVSRLLSLAALLLTATAARADILFIDMHLATTEVEAARKAAAARGEKLIVIPDVPDSLRKEVQPWLSELNSLDERADRYRKELKKEKPGSRTYERIQAKLNEIQGPSGELFHRKQALFSRLRWDASKINEALAKLEASGANLTSLIISGHSGGTGHIWGGIFQGSTTIFAIDKMFDKYPRLREGIRSVLLWGCYGTTPYNSLWWLEKFPNAHVVLGFGLRGPDSYKSSGVDTLQRILEHDDDYMAQMNLRRVIRQINKLPGGRGITNLAGIANGCYISSTEPELNQTVRNLNRDVFCDIPKDGKSPRQLLEQAFLTYECYFLGKDEKCAAPPQNKSDSDLRSAYNIIQSYRTCAPADALFPSPDQVLRLIFFQNLLRNFAAHYGSQLERLMEQPRSIALNGAVNRVLRNLGNVNRRDVTTMCDSLDEIQGESSIASRVAHGCRSLLGNLNCGPISWATETPGDGQLPEAPGFECEGR